MTSLKKKFLMAALTFGMGLGALQAEAQIIKCDKCTCSEGTCVCTGCQ